MRGLVLVGDIHGEYRTLIWNITNRYKITNSDVVILGDFGVGFDKSLDSDYKRSEKKLIESDLMIYALRGNHDDPQYFTDEEKYSYPRLRFMEDYKVYTLGNNKTILPIGGANSIDIEDRLKNNQKFASMGSDKRCWWEGEDVTRIDLSTLPIRVNLILSHCAPLTFEPLISKPEMCPTYQYEKILETRKYLDTILNYTRADGWFYGHYHNHYSGFYSGIQWRCLDIMEFFQVPDKEIDNPQGEDKDEDKENKE